MWQPISELGKLVIVTNIQSCMGTRRILVNCNFTRGWLWTRVTRGKFVNYSCHGAWSTASSSGYFILFSQGWFRIDGIPLSLIKMCLPIVFGLLQVLDYIMSLTAHCEVASKSCDITSLRRKLVYKRRKKMEIVIYVFRKDRVESI